MNKVTTFDVHITNSRFMSVIIGVFTDCLVNKSNLEELRDLISKEGKLLFKVLGKYQTSGVNPGAFKID